MNAICEPPVEQDRPPAAPVVQVHPLDPLKDGHWDEAAASHPDASPFHSAAWTRVLARTYGHVPLHFSCFQESRLAALVPILEVRSALTGTRGVCVPFADFCGPLLFDQNTAPAVLQALVTLARERRWRYFEIRSDAGLPSSIPSSVSYYAHALELRAGPDQLLAGFDASVRRALRKAEREGLAVRIRQDPGGVLDFYRLHCRTRRKHGLPPQPLSFFQNIHEEIIAAGRGFVVVATAASKPVSAAIFFHQGKRALYKYGAGDERVQELRANNLVMWHGIQSLASMGMESLHFGRTSAGDEGLRRYKLGWGTVETRLEYHRFDVRADAWTKGRDETSGVHNAVFSRLPLFCNRLLGRMIYSHLD